MRVTNTNTTARPYLRSVPSAGATSKSPSPTATAGGSGGGDGNSGGERIARIEGDVATIQRDIEKLLNFKDSLTGAWSIASVIALAAGIIWAGWEFQNTVLDRIESIRVDVNANENAVIQLQSQSESLLNGQEGQRLLLEEMRSAATSIQETQQSQQLQLEQILYR